MLVGEDKQKAEPLLTPVFDFLDVYFASYHFERAKHDKWVGGRTKLSCWNIKNYFLEIAAFRA